MALREVLPSSGARVSHGSVCVSSAALTCPRAAGENHDGIWKLWQSLYLPWFEEQNLAGCP